MMEAAAVEMTDEAEVTSEPRRRGRPPKAAKASAPKRGRQAKTAPLVAVAPLALDNEWAPLALESVGIDSGALHRTMVVGDARARLFAVFVARAAQVGPDKALEELR
jgi:hypothetical protein